METLIQYIVGDAQTFEPAVMVGLIVFVLILESICRLIGTITKGVQR